MNGQVCPKTQNGYQRHSESQNFGTRVSSHELWDQLTPDGPVMPGAWSDEVVIFLNQFAKSNFADGVNVKAVSKNQKKQIDRQIRPKKYVAAEETILSLRPDKNNLTFHPIPTIDGENVDQVTMGWATIVNAHPFTLYPEPVIYWQMGRFHWQGLVPWHEAISIEESCQRIEYLAESIDGAGIYSTPEDLLYLPGSLIHHPKQKSRTATVLYDAFTATQFDDPHVYRCNY